MLELGHFKKKFEVVEIIREITEEKINCRRDLTLRCI